MKKVYLIVALLLGVFFLQTFTAMLRENDTFDESLHLTSGYSYWKTGEFRLNTLDHPPFAEMLAAFPLLFLGLDFPKEHPALWAKQRYRLSDQFVYRNVLPAQTLLFWSRLPIVLLALALGFFIFFWSASLWGNKGGIFSLFLFAFFPELLAHAHYVTTDLAATALAFLTILAFRYYQNRPDKKTIFLAGLLLGLALASKFTTVLLLPILLFFTFYPKKNKIYLSHVLIFLFTAVFFLALAYGFKDFGYYFAGVKRLLPGGDIFGGRSAFLFGQNSTSGWWYYFPLAFLIKTPLPLLILIGVKLFSFFSRNARLKPCPTKNTEKNISDKDKDKEVFLIVPILVFFVAACFSTVNIGIRHLMPIFPFLLVWVGSLGSKLQIPPVRSGCAERSRPFPTLTILLVFLLGWYGWATIRIWPHYLAYFNELVGGPKNGYKYLVDSNLDWGQDLINLKKYLAEHKIEEIYLSYFGNSDPACYGINYRGIGFYTMMKRLGKAEKLPALEKQIFVLSATNLQGVYFHDKNVFQWLKKYPLLTQIGYSLFVYDLTNQVEAHQQLEKLFQQTGEAGYSQRERQFWEKLLKDEKNIN
ncbi:MAG: glycosyltransferase family 39 protein [Elusimicrobiota bacterium]